MSITKESIEKDIKDLEMYNAGVQLEVEKESYVDWEEGMFLNNVEVNNRWIENLKATGRAGLSKEAMISKNIPQLSFL